MKMVPFFCFFGGKFRAAPRYPKPAFGKIVEPFAGAAGYSVRHYTADVRLVDTDPMIVGLWKYLIGVSADEVRRLPLLENDQTVDDLGDAPQEARHLVGFWLNKGTAQPRLSPSAWMRSKQRPRAYWGVEVRERIATQVQHIRHWKVQHGSYTSVPNPDATWFIDPQYVQAGKSYTFSSKDINYTHLGEWCTERKGQVIVCENQGADWLPFQPFASTRNSPNRHHVGTVSKESIYLQG
jgi:hypothetical protein